MSKPFQPAVLSVNITEAPSRVGVGPAFASGEFVEPPIIVCAVKVKIFIPEIGVKASGRTGQSGKGVGDGEGDGIGEGEGDGEGEGLGDGIVDTSGTPPTVIPVTL